MWQRPDAANHRKNLRRMVVALDGPRSNGCKGNTILDVPGDNRIDQYLRVLRQIAKPRPDGQTPDNEAYPAGRASK